jgi:zinc ribbon protein
VSVSARLAETCAGCGADLPAGARYCPSCGASVGDDGDTARERVPLHETDRGPVTHEISEPHWFGVAPPHLLLGLAVALFGVAIVLFAIGDWPYGLIVLGVAALVLAAFLEAARRRPERRLGRRSIVARERAQSAVETWRVRSAAAADARRLRQALAVVDRDRQALLHELGAAVHRGDARAEGDVRGRLAALDAREAELRTALDATLAGADRRIREARLPVQETMMVLPTEPAPPPDEGTPPQPATVPEPYPPPDEGTPPQPARIPEPSPDPEPDSDS